MNKLNVLIVGDWHYVHVRRWAKGLVDRGIEVTVLSNSSGVARGLDRVSVISAGVPPWRPWRPLRWLGRYRAVFLRALERVKPDLVHVHFPGPYSVPEDLLGRFPLIISTWGSDVIPQHPEERGDWDRKSHLIRSADAVIASSLHLRDETARYAGIQPDRVLLLYWGIDLGRFKPAGLPSGEPVVGFVKALMEVYGPDTVIDCMPSLLTEIPELRLMMIGRGGMEWNLRRRSERLGVGRAIDWAGYVDNESLPAYYGAMRVTVMPSRREALGISAIESQAMGVPVVASRVGGIPECVMDGVTGLLVPPDNPAELGKAIKTLLTDTALWDHFAKQCRINVIDKFNIAEMLDNQIKIYKNFSI